MATPITGLDCIELLVDDLPQATRDYELLLGRKAGSTGNGASLRLGNVTLLLRQSTGSPGLGLLRFEVDEPARMARRLGRLGLSTFESVGPGGGAQTFEIDQAATYSMPLGYSLAGRRGREIVSEGGDILGLDHIVIATQQADRAAALYGARLGLDMRFDTTRPDWGLRLMFFRCGDLVLEIVQSLSDGVRNDDDRLHGFSWRTRDAEITHARLSREGFHVSDIRPGRRPHTRVFTVRSRTAGIRTLFVELSQPAAAQT